MFDQVTNEFDLGEQYALDYAGDPAGTQLAVQQHRNTHLPARPERPGQQRRPRRRELRSSSGRCWACTRRTRVSDTLLLNSPGFAARVDRAAQRQDDHGQRPGRRERVLRQGPDDQRQVRPEAVHELRRPEQGRHAGLDPELEADQLGQRVEGRPAVLHRRLDPTVGYLANQTTDVAPGKSSTLTIGANNATDKTQRVTVDITAPSGVTIKPSSTTITVPPHGTGTAKLTVSAASGHDAELLQRARQADRPRARTAAPSR